MKTSNFKYDLPEELIAQVPIEDRSSSRLMVVDKNTGQIEHRVFKDIIGISESVRNVAICTAASLHERHADRGVPHLCFHLVPLAATAERSPA